MADVPVKKQWTFDLRQLSVLVGIVTAVSGLGGAGTVAVSDKLQDQRIESNERAIAEIREDVKKARESAVRTETTTEDLKSDVSTIKEDVKSVERLLNQLLGREQGRNGRPH